MTRANRGTRVLAANISRREFGYIVTLTMIVTLVGAARMYTFENEVPVESGLHNYGSALWYDSNANEDNGF